MVMIDVHSHILPDLDDGSKSLDMSMDMAMIYLEEGITKVIATPHYMDRNTALGDIDYSYNTLKEELVNRGIELEVYLGNEILASMDIVSDIKEGRVYSLNRTKYVLVEFPMNDVPMFSEHMIYELLLEGFIPVIAHPERNAKIIEDPNILYEFIKKGALSQMNLPSLGGRYGEKVRDTAAILLKNHMVHMVGTDAHSNRGRSPRIKKSLEILRSMVSKEEFYDLIKGNARQLLMDEDIQVRQPIMYEKPRGWMSVFKRISTF